MHLFTKITIYTVVYTCQTIQSVQYGNDGLFRELPCFRFWYHTQFFISEIKMFTCFQHENVGEK